MGFRPWFHGFWESQPRALEAWEVEDEDGNVLVEVEEEAEA